MAQNLAISELFAPTKAGVAARDYFAQNGLPNRRNEDFHYTDLSRALSDVPTNSSIFYEYPAPTQDIEIRILESGAKILGSHDKITISEFEPEQQTDVFAQLIYGLAKTGHKIEIADNTNLTISIIRFGNSRAVLDFEIGKNAKVEIIEIHEGGGLCAFSTRLNIGEDATLNFYSKLQGGGVDLSAIGAIQAANSQFNAYFTSEGGQMVRRNFGTVLSGENATINIGGVYLLGNSHFDFFSNIIHQVPNCNSQESVRGVVAAGAHAVFQGKILVAKDAQKTIGNMEHRALMLADGARINAKPTLEIYADDVECSHANTIGAISESALFYMQSRGITIVKAKALLTEAFLAQVFDDVTNQTQKELMLAKVRAILEGLVK
jgi:Fe-S cluster assembly protein SufD